VRKEGRTRLGLAGPFGVSYSRVIFGWNLGGLKWIQRGLVSQAMAEHYGRRKEKGATITKMAQKSIPPIITQSVSLYFFTSHICQSILGLILCTFHDLSCTPVRFLAPEDRLDLDLLEENKLRVKLC